MNETEAAIRAIKDRVAAAMGVLDEAAVRAARKENHRRLSDAASEIHNCADELQRILMRIKAK